jgi:hypothetical protein
MMVCLKYLVQCSAIQNRFLSLDIKHDSAKHMLQRSFDFSP